jgi:TIR domain-containing protein/PASTA domain-containing protein
VSDRNTPATPQPLDGIDPPNRSPYRIFISYSREDAAFVQPVVKLLRTGDEEVFFDIDSVRAGSRWRQQLDAALKDARLLIVFWCLHSSGSTEVSREYEAAIAAEKDVVPVLLDWTPLPATLSAFQWVDLRRLGRSEHGWFTRSGAKVSRYAVAIVLCVSVLGGMALWLESGRRKSPEYPRADAPAAPSSSVSPTSVPAAANPVTTTTTPVTIPPQVTTPLQVPDLRGRTRDQAVAILADRGLVVGQVAITLSNDTPGTVVSQQPAGASRVQPGTSVDLVLALPGPGTPEVGAPPIPMPVVWLLLGALIAALVAGIAVTARTRSVPAPNEKTTRRQRRAARILTREVASRLDPHG